MIFNKYTSAGLILVALLLFSCKKTNNSPNQTSTNYQDVIIGCKPGGNIKAAIDPISANQFSFNTTLAAVSVTGPSTLNATKTYYYCLGSDKMVDEVDVNTGAVNRSFSVSGFPSFMHYRSGNNSILCVSPLNTNHEYRVSEISLNTGSESDLFTFTSTYGMLVRTSFMRDSNLYFVNGRSELLELNLNAETLQMAVKLQGLTNFLVYDAPDDLVYYLHSENLKDFSLYSCDFSSNTKLKNYPNLKSLALGSITYDAGAKMIYLYTTNDERADIDLDSLSLKLSTVSYRLINTEIVSCKVKSNSIE